MSDARVSTACFTMTATILVTGASAVISSRPPIFSEILRAYKILLQTQTTIGSDKLYCLQGINVFGIDYTNLQHAPVFCERQNQIKTDNIFWNVFCYFPIYLYSGNLGYRQLIYLRFNLQKVSILY